MPAIHNIAVSSHYGHRTNRCVALLLEFHSTFEYRCILYDISLAALHASFQDTFAWGRTSQAQNIIFCPERQNFGVVRPVPARSFQSSRKKLHISDTISELVDVIITFVASVISLRENLIPVN